MASTGFSGIYRDWDSGVGACNRPIMYADVTVGTILGPGTHWVDASFGGTLTSGPFVPPTTVLGSTSPCSPYNGLQWLTTWMALRDSGNLTAQDLKFEVHGTAFDTDLAIETGVGQPVRLAARIGFSTRFLGAPTGTVSFWADTTELGTVSLSGAAASLSVTFPDAGAYRITAVHSGDRSFAASKGALPRGQEVGGPTLR